MCLGPRRSFRRQDFHQISSIFIDFHQFSSIFIDFSPLNCHKSLGIAWSFGRSRGFYGAPPAPHSVTGVPWRLHLERRCGDLKELGNKAMREEKVQEALRCYGGLAYANIC